MTITRWDPFRDLVSLQDRMNRLFDESLRSRAGEEDISDAAWAPPVDIYQTPSKIVVKAELPEVDRKDIDINVDNGILTLRGERKLQEEIKKEDYYRMERQYGTFSRSFSLPGDVDQNEIEAVYQEGVLTIEIPKSTRSKPRQIHIK
jgi:HSP20 family protein